MNQQIIIGLSGHIDHGKTSIVKALTGKNTDTLKQEIDRGMTIDIGFAHLSDKITIIDVPGHEKFIKNMVVGVSSIDLAILVIAADDGIMPQTKEHFEILKILNVDRGIVVINKIDLVDQDWLDLVELEIKELVKNSFLENQPVYKISAFNNIGIDELKEYILNISITKSPSIKNDRGLFRMYADRSFSQQGFGTVVTGTVLSGQINTGDKISILPINKTARLRSAQSHYNNIDFLNTGDRGALNLHGISVDEVKRGSHLSNYDYFKSVNKFIAKISILEDSGIKLKQNQRLRFHIGTAEVIGRISICNDAKNQLGSSIICLIKLEHDVVVAFQDQFVVRTYSPMKVVGGGTVEDIECIGKWSQIKEYALKLSYNQSIEDKINFIIENQAGNPITCDDICNRLSMSMSRIIEYLDINKKYVIINYFNEKWVVGKTQLNNVFEKIVFEIEVFHKENPYRLGIVKKELQQKTKINESFLNFCINQLVEDFKLAQKEEVISLKDFKINLSDSEILMESKVVELLNQQGFCSQSYTELGQSLNISSDKIKFIISMSEKNQKIIRLNEDLLFTVKNFNKLVEDIKKYFQQNDKMTVSDFKNIANTSRKYAVPLLEYLDKKNITYRQENYRKLL